MKIKVFLGYRNETDSCNVLGRSEVKVVCDLLKREMTAMNY